MLDLERQFGKMLAIQGEKATVSTLLIAMAVKLQATTKVLYIDSANTFNPLFLKKSYHKPPTLNLKQILIARPFTADQFAALAKKIDQAATQTRSKAIIISDIEGLFHNPLMNEHDALFMFAQVIEDIAKAARRHDAVVLVGLSADPQNPRTIATRKALEASLDMCCNV